MYNPVALSSLQWCAARTTSSSRTFLAAEMETQYPLNHNEHQRPVTFSHQSASMDFPILPFKKHFSNKIIQQKIICCWDSCKHSIWKIDWMYLSEKKNTRFNGLWKQRYSWLYVVMCAYVHMLHTQVQNKQFQAQNIFSQRH